MSIDCRPGRRPGARCRGAPREVHEHAGPDQGRRRHQRARRLRPRRRPDHRRGIWRVFDSDLQELRGLARGAGRPLQRLRIDRSIPSSGPNGRSCLRWRCAGPTRRASALRRSPSCRPARRSASSTTCAIRRSAPTPDPNNPNCAVSFPATSTSNPALQPEKSKNFSAGVIFEPVDNVSLTFDAFKIKRRNEVIDPLDPDYAARARGPVPRGGRAQPGRHDQPTEPDIRQPGLDQGLGLRHRRQGARRTWARSASSASSPQLRPEPSYKVVERSGRPQVEFAGTYEQPKNRSRVGFSFDRGPWTSSLTFNYTGQYELNARPGQPVPLPGDGPTRSCARSSRF